MSNYNVELLQDGEEKKWDLFLRETINPSFYSSTRFNNFYAWKVDEVLRLVFRKKDRIIGIIAGGVVNSEGKMVFNSPYSSSFSGFCYSDHLSLLDANNIIGCFEEFLSKKGVSEIFICQSPQCYLDHFDESFNFLLDYNDYLVSKKELSYFITRESFCNSKISRNVRKACSEGLRLLANIDVETACEFLILHKKKRNLGLSIPAADIVGLSKLLGGKIHCHGVYSGENLVAAIIVYVLGKTTVMGFNWDQDYDFQQYRCTDFLLYEVVSYYFDLGFTKFDLGTATINGEPNWGLLKYKEKLGGIGCLRTTYRKSLISE